MTEQGHKLATLIKAVQDLTEKVDLNHRETSQRLTALEGADQPQAGPSSAPQNNNNAKTADTSASSQDQPQQQPTRHHHQQQLQQNQQFVPLPQQASIVPPYQAGSLNGHYVAPISGYISQPSPTPVLPRRAARPESDIQCDFKALKDSLVKVRLHSDLCVNDSRTGIKREDQGAYDVLVKAARYVETSLKVLDNIQQAGDVTQQDLENLALCGLAQVRYLQDEYSALVVQGTCSKDIGRLFRSFRRNTSGLTEDAIDDLRNASQVAAAMQPQQNSQQYQPQRQGRSSGRGFRFQNGRGRGQVTQWQSNRDSVYGNFTSRGVPSRRNNEDGTHQDQWSIHGIMAPINPLTRCVDKWAEIGASDTVTDWIVGCVPVRLINDETPPCFNRTNPKFNPAEKHFVRQELSDLLSLGIIEQIFYIPFCISPIKTGKKERKR